MAKKQAKFYCENCGAEVAQNARFCNKCGRFFSKVRCPACGKTGSSNAFVNGCPSCGYAGKPSKDKRAPSSETGDMVSVKGHFYFHKKHSFGGSGNNFSRDSRFVNENGLPLWIYALTLGALVVLIFAIMRCSGN